MKKIYLTLAMVATLGMFSSCSDDDYTSKYTDPSKTSTASCDKLMTGVFLAGKQYTFNTYWRMYTWDNGIIGKYAQTIGFVNNPGSMYSAQDSYVNDRWSNFYTILAQYRTLQDVYSKESATSQADDKIFLDLSEVFLYDHLTQIIDIWGDVPFSTAGNLSLTGDVKGSRASYDDAKTLYTDVLKRLGELATDIQSLSGNLSPITSAALPSQDYINKGDLTRWVKYCNDLRLRLAVRVASQGDLASTGRAAIAEILNSNASLSTTFDDNISLVGDNGSTDEFNFSDAIRDGYKDHSRASQQMLDVLQTSKNASVGQDDYRLPIMYSKNSKGEYKGLSPREDYGDQETNVSFNEAQRVYSRIDSTTVIYNQYLRQPIITTAEVDFLRAECYLNGWANGGESAAKAAFINGVVNSTKYYFDCNAASESSYGFKGTEPAEADVRAYAEKLWNAEPNKLKVIIEQKWLNFGFLQPSQAWNEVRRTGYPELYFQTDNTAQIVKEVPVRVQYPGSERSYNTDNYNAELQKMGGSDSYYIKLFWAK